LNVLVTGASGFLGRNLLLRAPADWSVTATYRTSADFPRFVSERCRKGQVEAIRCDLEISDAVEHFGRIRSTFELCIFLAANTSVPLSVKEPAIDLKANTLTVLNVLKSVSIKHFVFLSSGAVYDGIHGAVGPGTPVLPSLPYAISKLASELYTRRAQADGKIRSHAIIRFFGAYGPHEPARKIYSRLVEELGIQRRGVFKIYGDGSNLIDAMYVEDAIAALLKVCVGVRPHVTVDLAAGEPISVRDLVSRAARYFLGREVIVQTEGTAHEAIGFRPDTGPFASMFQFRPKVTLEEGLGRMLDHRLRVRAC